MKFVNFLPLFLVFVLMVQYADASTIKQTMEGGMDVEITHPDTAVQGRTISISILVNNNGWEDKKEISFVLTSPDLSIKPATNNQITIDKLSTSGTYGTTFDFEIAANASPGVHFLNVLYSQILVSNNVDPQEPTHSNIAIPIIVKNQPKVNVHVITPDAIFPNAEFPISVQLISEDIDIENVNVRIIPPSDFEFRGETMHNLSVIERNQQITVNGELITPHDDDITKEYKIPFQILVTYTDDIGDEKTNSQTVQLLLRPRTFMELTTDGGIWIGDFFVAPYVSIGTLVGIPVGTILSIIIRRKQGGKKKKRKTN